MAAYSDIGGLDSHPAPVFSFDGIGDFGHASQPNVIIVSQAGDSLNGDIPVLKPIGGFYERFTWMVIRPLKAIECGVLRIQKPVRFYTIGKIQEQTLMPFRLVRKNIRDSWIGFAV